MQIWSFLSCWGSNLDPCPTADATRRLTFLSVALEHCFHSLFVPLWATKNQHSSEYICLFSKTITTPWRTFHFFFSSQWTLWINSMLYPCPPPPLPAPPPLPSWLSDGLHIFIPFHFKNSFLLLLFFFPRVLRGVGGEGGCCYKGPSASQQLESSPACLLCVCAVLEVD